MRTLLILLLYYELLNLKKVVHGQTITLKFANLTTNLTLYCYVNLKQFIELFLSYNDHILRIKTEF